MKLIAFLRHTIAFLSLTSLLPSISGAEAEDGKLRIIFFGAHPVHFGFIDFPRI